MNGIGFLNNGMHKILPISQVGGAPPWLHAGLVVLSYVLWPVVHHEDTGNEPEYPPLPHPSLSCSPAQAVADPTSITPWLFNFSLI